MRPQEIWKNIPGHRGYQASNLGRIRSKKRAWRGWVFLKLSDDKYGYKQVSIQQGGKEKSRRVHRLVLMAFSGRSKKQVNHKNGIKTDNRLKNLEYVTAKQNAAHAKANGLFVAKRGSFASQAKLKEGQVLSIRRSQWRVVDLAKKFNISTSQIYRIKSKQRWGHI